MDMVDLHLQRALHHPDFSAAHGESIKGSESSSTIGNQMDSSLVPNLSLSPI